MKKILIVILESFDTPIFGNVSLLLGSFPLFLSVILKNKQNKQSKTDELSIIKNWGLLNYPKT